MNKLYFRSLFQTRLPRRLISLLILSVLIGVLTIGTSVSAQEQDPEDTITVSTALVQLNVGVVDSRGQAIRSLSKNDFTVYENGVK